MIITRYFITTLMLVNLTKPVKIKLSEFYKLVRKHLKKKTNCDK
jgi:hypothetical protein